MTLVDYLSGLFPGPPRRAPESRTGAVKRDPSPSNPVVAESGTFERGPSYVYECRRCGMTVSAETIVCPRCERPTIAEYPVR